MVFFLMNQIPTWQPACVSAFSAGVAAWAQAMTAEDLNANS